METFLSLLAKTLAISSYRMVIKFIGLKSTTLVTRALFGNMSFIGNMAHIGFIDTTVQNVAFRKSWNTLSTSSLMMFHTL